jgi:hypothetical protein
MNRYDDAKRPTEDPHSRFTFAGASTAVGGLVVYFYFVALALPKGCGLSTLLLPIIYLFVAPYLYVVAAVIAGLIGYIFKLPGLLFVAFLLLVSIAAIPIAQSTIHADPSAAPCWTDL